jgi:hypothetical protein
MGSLMAAASVMLAAPSVAAMTITPRRLAWLSRAALIFRFSKCADRSRAYSNFICSEIPTGATNLLYI